MQHGESIKWKFTPFKKRLETACGENGMVLEKIGGGVCLYATDAGHETIHCVMPLGFEKDFKDANYYVYAIDDQYMIFRVKKAVLLVDYVNRCCSTNVKDFKMYGSTEWGINCTVPWKDSYTALYTEAEKRRVGET